MTTSYTSKTEVLLYFLNPDYNEKLVKILENYHLSNAPDVRTVYRMIDENNPSLIITDSPDIDISTLEKNIPLLMVCSEDELKKGNSLPSHIWDYITVPFHPDLIRRRVNSYASGSYQIQNDSRHMRLIFDLVPSLIFVKNREGRFLEVNKAVADQMGLTVDEVVGSLQADVQPERKDVKRMLQDDREVFETGKTIHLAHERIRDTYGNIHWLQTTRTPCPKEIFGEEALIGIATDITKLKKTEEELRKSQENLLMTLRSIGDGVIVVNPDGLIKEMNPIAEKMTGWKAEAVKDRELDSILQIINPESREREDNIILKVLETGQICRSVSHSILISGNGTEHLINQSGAPIHGEDGSIEGIVIVFRDMTEENTRQIRFMHRDKMEALENLAGGIAHDFNNILGGLQAAAELLRDEVGGNVKAMEYSGMIRESSGQAIKLIQKLAGFSRRNSRSDAPVDVHSAIRESMAGLRDRIGQRVKAGFSLDAEDFRIRGIQADLQQAIESLVMRSAHSMPGGGSINLTTENRILDDSYCRKSLYELCPGQYIALEISDTGAGIPLEDMPHIFEPFYKSESIKKGSSLDLAGVYSTIVHLNGAVEIKSIQNEATSFTLLIPTYTETGDNTETENTAGPADKTVNILIVDDEPVLQKMLANILEKEGYHVVIADNGKNGLFQFKKNPNLFDLIIMDMVMPEMTGADCADAIKRINPEIKILFISGYFNDQNMKEVNESDSTGFIHKPFGRDVILSKVKEML